MMVYPLLLLLLFVPLYAFRVTCQTPCDIRELLIINNNSNITYYPNRVGKTPIPTLTRNFQFSICHFIFNIK